MWESNDFLHKKICDSVVNSSERVVGIDIDSESVEYLRVRMPGEKIIEADAHNLPRVFGDRQFDLIIAGDVIEHLENAGQFLESCKSVLSEGGEIILTTVNAYSLMRFLKSALYHEAVHDEHTAYYSHKTLGRLLGMIGLKTVEDAYYRCEPMRQFSLNLLISNNIERIATIVWPQWSEGIIVVAKPE